MSKDSRFLGFFSDSESTDLEHMHTVASHLYSLGCTSKYNSPSHPGIFSHAVSSMALEPSLAKNRFVGKYGNPNSKGRIIPGWWCNNHLEKYESQWEGLSHILWKIKHVPNHQPEPY